MQHHGTYCLCASPSLHDHISVHCKNVHTKGVPQSKYIIWILIETQNLDLLMYIMEWEKKIHVFKKYISSQTCDFPYFPDKNSFFLKKKNAHFPYGNKENVFFLLNMILLVIVSLFIQHILSVLFEVPTILHRNRRGKLWQHLMYLKL